jgi:hypothetical protein
MLQHRDIWDHLYFPGRFVGICGVPFAGTMYFSPAFYNPYRHSRVNNVRVTLASNLIAGTLAVAKPD